jgi:plasmid stabilization system protein ParE
LSAHGMKVLITAEAEADLEAVSDYIARDNPSLQFAARHIR